MWSIRRTHKVVSTIDGIEAAHGVAFSPDGTRVYASNEADHTVDVFDQKTGKLIKKVALSGRPNNLAVAKDGRIVVAIAQEPGALDIIDPVKLERKVSILTNGRLHNTYVTPDSRFAIMGSTRTNIFTVIDLQKEEIAWELNLGKGVRPMTMETNPGRLDQARVHAAIGPQRLRDRRLRLAQDGRQDRAADDAQGIDVIHHRLTSPSHGMGVQPDNKVLWVTSILANAVVAYSLPDLKVIGQVSLPTIKVRRPYADGGGAELGDVHARQPADLRLQRRAQFGVGDRHTEDCRRSR